MTADFPLPPNLPVPADDGACDHLLGMAVPALSLPSTQGGAVNLAEAARGLAVFYLYPLSGRPDRPLPPGWDDIPGARGCTPQACAFRDHFAELAQYEASVYGISAQDTGYQQEFATRMHLPFPLLADPELKLATTLRLPTFEAAGLTLYRRVTLIARDGRIAKVFYPVFPPDQNADAVLAWLRESGSPRG